MSPTLRREAQEWQRANPQKTLIGMDEIGLWWNVALAGGGQTTGLTTWNKLACNLAGVIPLESDPRLEAYQKAKATAVEG
mgnify:CR=1 FL=1